MKSLIEIMEADIGGKNLRHANKDRKTFGDLKVGDEVCFNNGHQENEEYIKVKKIQKISGGKYIWNQETDFHAEGEGYYADLLITLKDGKEFYVESKSSWTGGLLSYSYYDFMAVDFDSYWSGLQIICKKIGIL